LLGEGKVVGWWFLGQQTILFVHLIVRLSTIYLTAKYAKFYAKSARKIYFEFWIINFKCVEMSFFHSTLRLSTFDYLFNRKGKIVMNYKLWIMNLRKSV
jgi:hypothetical protein